MAAQRHLSYFLKINDLHVWDTIVLPLSNKDHNISWMIGFVISFIVVYKTSIYQFYTIAADLSAFTDVPQLFVLKSLCIMTILCFDLCCIMTKSLFPEKSNCFFYENMV